MTNRSTLAALLALLAACSDTGLTDVRPRLAFDPDKLEFGERPVLDDLTKEISLQNIGGADLRFTAPIRLEGDDVFKLPDALPSGIDRGSETAVAITFVAKEMKEYSAKLVIETDDVDNPRVEIPITGRGSTAARALIEPRALDFGRVGESRSAVRRVKITSVGTADLKIRTIKFKPGSSASYGFLGSTQTGSLRKHEDGKDDEFAEVSVRFSPSPLVPETAGVLLLETTDPDNAIVEIPLTALVNKQPLAVPGADRAVAPGTSVQLDGSASSDPDGDDPITFQWKLLNRPQGSATTLADADTARPTLVPDQPGAYVLELIVTDAAGLASVPERVQVSGVSSDKLVVELTWDHPLADLDLHVRPENTPFNGPKDCTGDRPHPDWGLEGSPDDDPSHSGDVLSGYGPERVLMEAPAEGRYVIAARYVSPQGSPNRTVRATVRVRLYGVIVSELQHLFDDVGEVWETAAVAWPSGLVTPAGATP